MFNFMFLGNYWPIFFHKELRLRDCSERSVHSKNSFFPSLKQKRASPDVPKKIIHPASSQYSNSNFSLTTGLISYNKIWLKNSIALISKFRSKKKDKKKKSRFQNFYLALTSGSISRIKLLNNSDHQVEAYSATILSVLFLATKTW